MKRSLVSNCFLTLFLCVVLMSKSVYARDTLPNQALYKSGNALFKSSEYFSPDKSAFTKWTGVQRKMRHSNATDDGVRRFVANLLPYKNSDMMTKLRQVNNAVNMIRFVSDQKNWGKSDHWASPAEFLSKKAGDCEDFALLKMHVLQKLGVPSTSMRLVVVQDQIKKIPHAILSVRHQGKNYILDNQDKSILQDTQIKHYRPYYSIAQQGWWKHTPKSRVASLR